MLDLTFSPEQEMLRETVRGVLATTSPLSVVRGLEDDPTGYSTELWAQLGALDLIGLQLPEEFGGSGMTTLETVVVYEEFGRAIAPSPHFVSSILSGGALARSGSAEQKQAWLPGIVTGEAILTPAWLEPPEGPRPVGDVALEPGGQVRGVEEDVAGPVAVDGEVLVVVHRPPVPGGQRPEHDGGGGHRVGQLGQLVAHGHLALEQCRRGHEASWDAARR